MIALSIGIAGILGITAGFLLLWRVPTGATESDHTAVGVSVVIPARNEERNLPFLLSSLQDGGGVAQLIVVDDHSSDATATVATTHGAQLVAAPPLPAAWTGKNWACLQGALAAKSETLLFIDADTWFAPHAIDSLVCAYNDGRIALSVLPFHVTSEPYEELSIFFNLLMAFGAGGFGLLARPRLFGQSLLISRELYQDSGTHAAVAPEILENLALATAIEASGGRCKCIGGRGTLNMRMFPHGLSQLCEGWIKAFAVGAHKTDRVILLTSIFWLSALCFVFICLFITRGHARLVSAALYVLLSIQLKWMASQIGTFRWYTCAFFPVPLLFFFALFARSANRRARGQHVTWRGRQL